MLMAKNADICSKCLVTEPWVRSFTARSFPQRFNCSNSEYDRFQHHRVPVLKRRQNKCLVLSFFMFGVQRIIAEFCDVHKSTFRVRELHCLISVFVANLAKALCDCPAGFADM
jgi:hypothetical protein